MNQTTRTILFFSGLAVMALYYFLIIPLLPFANTNPIAYANYTFATLFVIFPITQAFLRRRVLNRYKIREEDFFFELPLQDARLIQHVTFIMFGYLFILRPLMPSFFDFSTLTMPPLISFILWMVFSECLLLLTYKKTHVQFGKSHILIMGFDFRIDMPFASPLYSHSGIYEYDNFDSFHRSGTRLIMTLHQDMGKISFVVPESLTAPVISFLKSKGINEEKL